MAQTKKDSVRNSILKSAKALYMRRGYANTSMAQIADGARISTANLYVYYRSKFDIFFAVYEVWFVNQLDVLEDNLSTQNDPRLRLEAILFFLWRDIPKADNNFANNLTQALSTKSSKEQYSRSLLLISEARLSKLIQPCLGPDLHHWTKDDLLAHMIFMAHDGFTINYNLQGPGGRQVKADRVESLVNALCDLYFPE